MAAAAPQGGQIVDDMRKKYGPDCLDMLDVWVERYGFPEGGSLSMEELKNLRDKLKIAEGKVTKKKKTNRWEIRMIKDHERCFLFWKTEAEVRDRKQVKKRENSAVRWSTGVTEITAEGAHTHTHSREEGEKETEKQPLTHEHSNAQNRLYPSLTGPRDPLLDMPVYPPPAYPQVALPRVDPAQPPANAAAAPVVAAPPAAVPFTAVQPSPAAPQAALPDPTNSATTALRPRTHGIKLGQWR